MKYLEFVNSLLKSEVAKHDNLVLFGQNISAGSCLGGLTRGLVIKDSGRVINSTNSENTLCGFGFGMMINGVSSVFFMKQLDFLLLGIDHLVNTYNIIRNMKQGNGSFTIMPIVVDNGYQGPQSSFNNLPDMCSIARIPGFSISTKWEAEKIISNELVSPGFRIITISQRLFKEELPSPEKLYYSNDDNTVFQYGSGNDATIVCFNFSFPQGYDLYQELKRNNINASIFNVTAATPTNWDRIIEDVQNTKKIVIIDDSKSQNLSCDALVTDIHLRFDLKKKIILKRILSDDWLDPVSDKMEIDTKSIINELLN